MADMLLIKQLIFFKTGAFCIVTGSTFFAQCKTKKNYLCVSCYIACVGGIHELVLKNVTIEMMY